MRRTRLLTLWPRAFDACCDAMERAHWSRLAWDVVLWADDMLNALLGFVVGLVR